MREKMAAFADEVKVFVDDKISTIPSAGLLGGMDMGRQVSEPLGEQVWRATLDQSAGLATVLEASPAQQVSEPVDEQVPAVQGPSF